MIYNFLSEYLSIIIFLFIAIFLSIGFVLANFLAAPSNPDPEKLSAYECGFEAFDDFVRGPIAIVSSDEEGEEQDLDVNEFMLLIHSDGSHKKIET